ncbi:MAG: RNA-binding cell elongation regulator Jag/EloR [Dethiobacteria bacterium]|jgi:spoIIIJ-associated protein
MKEIEITAKTVEEAVEIALNKLNIIKRSNADIEVLNEPSSGFLGFFGSRKAQVRVRVKYEPQEYLIELLTKILDCMGYNKAQVRIIESEPEIISVEITGDDLGVLIGRRGQTLNALQYLLNIVLRRQFKGLQKKVLLDIENYRQKREKTLKNLALNLARKVVQKKEQITLEPMTPQERRIIHLALQDNPYVVTCSKGEDPNRKVVISLK